MILLFIPLTSPHFPSLNMLGRRLKEGSMAGKGGEEEGKGRGGGRGNEGEGEEGGDTHTPMPRPFREGSGMRGLIDTFPSLSPHRVSYRSQCPLF